MIPISLYTQIFFQSEEARTTNDRLSSDSAIPTESLVGGRAIPGSLSIDDQLSNLLDCTWGNRSPRSMALLKTTDKTGISSIVLGGALGSSTHA